MNMRTKQRGSEDACGFPAGPSRGFTIVELLVSLVVFTMVMAAALSFLQVQNQGFKKGLDYMSTVQTLRYAVGTLEQDIQTAGTNLVAAQPEVVYAGPDVFAFNSDYATRTNDPFAVFFDPDLEDRVARSMTMSMRREIPLTSFNYPDTTYLDGSGLAGPAETLIFFFTPDEETDRSDDYALYRQVNAAEPQMVANHLLRVDGQPFFRYMKDSDYGIDSIPDAMLPLAHTVKVHESPADTGLASMVDSIRAVRISLAATNMKEGELERTSQVTRVVRMPNMGFGMLEICGSPPILGTGLNASLGFAPDTGEPIITLTWDKATDEAGGENDIVRYVLWRRTPSQTDWGEPYLSIPAGEGGYIYQDANLVPGTVYRYALATQDCTPTLSPLTTSEAITVPST
jgi:prepilin-type N-terminal cleavage/methylation domain-containing protein